MNRRKVQRTTAKLPVVLIPEYMKKNTNVRKMFLPNLNKVESLLEYCMLLRFESTVRLRFIACSSKAKVSVTLPPLTDY